MKLTSVTTVTLAAWGGSARSSLRAAYRPPKPPPRMSTFQDMAWMLRVNELGEPFGGHVPPRDRDAAARAAHVAGPPRQQRGHRAGAGGLGDGLDALEQE